MDINEKIIKIWSTIGSRATLGIAALDLAKKIDNLYAIIDKNNFQQTGSNKEIMSIESLKDKWSSFGWHTVELDGHNVKDLYNFFQENKNIKKPKAIIANTIKGKGFSFSENNNDWHHSILSKSFYEKAIKELKKE